MEPTDPVKPRSPRFFYGWVIVGVAFVVAFSEGALRNSLLSVFVVPMSEEFGWSRTALTGAISAGAIASSLVAPLVGPILDRRGPRGIMVAGVAITGGALMGLAFIGSLWHYYVFLIIGRSVSMSVVMLASMVAVANWFIRRRGRAVAISSVGSRASIPLFIILSQTLIVLYSWRVAWFATGIITIALGIPPTLLFMKRRPEDMGLLPDGDLPADPSDRDTSSRQAVQAQEVSWSLREAVRTRALWLAIVATSLAQLATQAVNLHALPSFMDRGISPAAATGVITFSIVVGTVANLVWGLVVERLHVRYTMALVYLFCAAGMLIITQAQSLPMAYAFGLTYGIGFGGIQLMGHILFADYFGRSSLGTIRGFTQPFNSIAGAVGPLLASLAYDLRSSYSVAFSVFMFSFTLAAGAVLLAAPPRKRSALQPV